MGARDGISKIRTARFEAFSDGVFAIAITLLVLDLPVPASAYSAHHLLDSFDRQWPAYLGYFVSFSTIGAIWLGHSAITDYLDRADSTLLRLNLVLLLLVTFLHSPRGCSRRTSTTPTPRAWRWRSTASTCCWRR